MKIAIQGHPTRGKEVIQILESLGGVNTCPLTGKSVLSYYYIDYGCNNAIHCHDTHYINNCCKKYTLEEFENEFPFKVGDEVIIITGAPYKIVALEYYMGKLGYKLNDGLHYDPETLTPYKEMKEERNITLTLDKAKEWYKKGGEFKEVVLQAFTEKELNPLPRSWEEFCKQGNPIIASWRYNIPIKYEALFKLEQLKDCYNNNSDAWGRSYSILKINGVPELVRDCKFNTFLRFKNETIAKIFLKNFKSLIEQAGDLI